VLGSGEKQEQRIIDMDTVENPSLTEERTRRAALLFRLLERCNRPEQALELAERMEQFVLHGAALLRNRENGCRTLEGDIGPVRSTAPDQGPEPACSVADVPCVTWQNGAKGTKKRRWTVEEDEKLQLFAEQGQSLEEIATALERTPVGIRERARARSIKVKPRKRPIQAEPSKASSDSGPVPASDAVKSESKSAEGAGRLHRLGKSRARKSRSRINGRGLDRQKEADMIKQFLLERGPTRPSESIDTVIKFMRTRDYSIVQGDNGHYVVDGRETVTPAELVTRANSLREELGRPPFPSDLAMAGAGGHSNGSAHLAGLSSSGF